MKAAVAGMGHDRPGWAVMKAMAKATVKATVKAATKATHSILFTWNVAA